MNRLKEKKYMTTPLDAIKKLSQNPTYISGKIPRQSRYRGHISK